MTLLHLTVLTVAAVGGYLGTCLIWPYKNCRTCRGQGKLRAFMGVRYCPPCDGTGLRLRAGRRFLDSIRQHRR
ncbi:hypothetical protein F1721_24885 [Saccharopolyspora hirsuta]|uniref:Uncharacterized protein n=1 Tax=Saccharopolyspora hirsuta TaxID=1837 RepID=A0A5M7BT53_SACHI|nr:hypothetical protein [Saccharopolyspora hirsuta]KAA5829555.1 hypothetical protein F1721_24885 [Saccharopolyspora hirsuta]MBF6511090.1 hypothetical protein [Nocardia farcinica]